MKRRVGLYLRISKDLRDGAGVERQQEDGQKLIEQRGWSLVDTYCDNDISATGRRRRPDYQRMLADLETGRIDTVVARSFERLCKSRREQLLFVELCQETSAAIAFTHAPDLDLTTAVGRGMADMMAAWARVEWEQKSERHISQIAQAARNGLILGGRRAFGYTADGMHLHPAEAPVLAVLYDRFLAGESVGSLTRWLNAEGHRTTRDNRWHHNSVREVLANPRNAAIRGMRPVANRRTGTRSQWHVEIGPAAWPPVVSEETWRAAMARIKDPTRPGNHAGYNQQKYLLTGIALCGVCGQPLITGGLKGDTERRSGRRARYRVVRCPTLRHISRRADYIEAYVVEQVIGYFTGPGRVMLPSGADKATAEEMEEIRSEAVRLRAMLRDIPVDLADGVLDREQAKIYGQRLRRKLAELDGRIAEAGRVDSTAPLRAAEDPEAVWDDMTIAAQRAVLRQIATVRVLPGAAGRPGGLRFRPESVQVKFRSGAEES